MSDLRRKKTHKNGVAVIKLFVFKNFFRNLTGDVVKTYLDWQLNLKCV